MKNNIGKIIFGFLIINIIISCIVIIFYKKNTYTRPDYNYSATIYHSEMLGMDAGTEYNYYIYKDSQNDNEYFYIKSKSNITIAGSGEIRDISSGSLNNINDLKKIANDIEKDSRKDSQMYISYTYVNDGKFEKVESISELGNKLFK